MCVCLSVCHLCPPLLFLFKVNISWVSSFWMFLTSQSRDLLSALSALPVSISRCAQHSFQTSLQISVCVYLYVCVCVYCVYIFLYRCLYACACALLPSSSVVFSLFSFQPLHEVMNAWVWFFFLPPLPLPPSHASSLFLLFWVFWFVPCFLITFGLFFILPPSSLPYPSLLFCDTASWDRSGRQPRSHTGQSTSHLNQSINQSVNQYLNPSSQSHNASF